MAGKLSVVTVFQNSWYGGSNNPPTKSIKITLPKAKEQYPSQIKTTAGKKANNTINFHF